MSRYKNQTEFQHEGYKRYFCPCCGVFLTETHLGEKNKREIKCKACGNVKTMAPPRIGFRNGVKGVYWVEENDSCWTATPNL